MSRVAKITLTVCALALVGAAALALAHVATNRRSSDSDASSATQTARASQDNINVVLISLDTTRQDHLSCYGYGRKTTPHIDALAKDSLVFTQCVAVSNWTLPTHASMLCGLYPTSHGAHYVTADQPHVNANDHAQWMASECQTLAEILQRAGYHTAAVVANGGWLNESFQINQGFDHFDRRAAEVRPPTYRRADKITDEAIGHLEGIEGPFLLLLNYMDPHMPYIPPPPYDTRFRSDSRTGSAEIKSVHFWRDVREDVLTNEKPLAPALKELAHDLYDGEIAYMDEHLGRLFDWLRSRGLYDQTLVIVTADHGEAFGEHLLMEHGLGLYEPEVAVPMIVKLPGNERRGIVEHAVQHVDILPTVLEVLDRPCPPSVQGTSMLETGSRDAFVEEYVCAGRARRWPRFDRAQWAVYRGRLKYIEYSDGEQELYDLGRDPEELENLAEVRTSDVRVLRESLRAWQDRTLPVGAGDDRPATPDAEGLRMLRDLGYVQ